LANSRGRSTGRNIGKMGYGVKGKPRFPTLRTNSPAVSTGFRDRPFQPLRHPSDASAALNLGKQPVADTRGHFPGGFNALFMDGSVRFINEAIDLSVLRASITRDGGEVVSSDSF
jgi:prepilin-type processing-associated H-X9-DG protein